MSLDPDAARLVDHCRTIARCYSGQDADAEARAILAADVELSHEIADYAEAHSDLWAQYEMLDLYRRTICESLGLTEKGDGQ